MGCRLNLGCGDERLDGWLHIDYRADVADVVADASRLPIASGTISEIRAMDLVEHFPADQTQPVLAEWRRVLQRDGTLTFKIPNMLEIARWILEGRRVGLVIRNIYGGHRWGPGGAWDTHHTGWTPDMIATELATAGFDILSNDLELNMTVTARRR